MTIGRREFIRWTARAAAAATLPFPLRLLAEGARAEFTQIRRNVGIFTERGGTIGWLMNRDGALIVDSQFADTAGVLVQGLRERQTVAIDVLLNTHHHPDHTGGNAVLRPLARRIVAHRRSDENQRQAARQRGNEDQQAFPDTTFSDSWSVEIGDERVVAKHYGPAHTGGDAAILFERANVVHLGDLLNNRGFPNVDGPAGASVHGWVRVLETIAPEFAADTIYVFGHSEAGYPLVGSREDLVYQRDYFLRVIDTAERAVREGRSREQAVALESLPGYTHFGGTASRLGLAIGLAYDEVVARR
jgi:cyclase